MIRCSCGAELFSIESICSVCIPSKPPRALFVEELNKMLGEADARAERLRVALELIASDPTNSAQAMVARKALEDDKPIRAAGDGR